MQSPVPVTVVGRAKDREHIIVVVPLEAENKHDYNSQRSNKMNTVNESTTQTARSKQRSIAAGKLDCGPERIYKRQLYAKVVKDSDPLLINDSVRHP